MIEKSLEFIKLYIYIHYHTLGQGLGQDIGTNLASFYVRLSSKNIGFNKLLSQLNKVGPRL